MLCIIHNSFYQPSVLQIRNEALHKAYGPEMLYYALFA
jgi:hypothetical protein